MNGSFKLLKKVNRLCGSKGSYGDDKEDLG